MVDLMSVSVGQKHQSGAESLVGMLSERFRQCGVGKCTETQTCLILFIMLIDNNITLR